MKRSTLPLLACPTCRGALDFSGTDENPLRSGRLACARCSTAYPIVDGIPRFVQADALTGFNKRFSRAYDLFAWGYRAFIKIAFAYIGMDEETGRREITDRLDPRDGSVLEVSIGPGNNLPYLMNRPDVGEVFGLDISIGQLHQCQRYLSKKKWDVDLFLGNGEQLPFQDEAFDGVLHVGGINFFNDKQAAIHEMIRVAKPGARILIADETEKGALDYERFLPGFKRSFGGKRNKVVPPMELIPDSMLEKRIFDVWNGYMYCIEFRRP